MFTVSYFLVVVEEDVSTDIENGDEEAGSQPVKWMAKSPLFPFGHSSQAKPYKVLGIITMEVSQFVSYRSGRH